MALDLSYKDKSKNKVMKKIILSAFAIATLQFAQAQQTQTAPTGPATPHQAPTPEQKATRDAAHLQKVLTLTDEQKQKVYQAALTRTNAMQQLKAQQAGGPKKALHAQSKPIKEQFVKEVNTALTPEQQQKWEAYRLEQKQKHEQRKTQAAPAGTIAPAAAPTKLEPQDDGMKD